MRTPPTPPQNIRLTITVTPEVHEVFQELANASSMSLGRAMGEWLGDTVDAAKFMAETMAKARAAPRLVAQELHAYALGLGDETGALIEKLREKGRADRRGSAAPARPALTPPSNTGVTNTKTKSQRGHRAS